MASAHLFTKQVDVNKLADPMARSVADRRNLRPSRPGTVLYGTTLFLSAFLLFWIQPLAGKYLLPGFGGAPSVWTSCLLFFQVLLLGGYSYSHLLVSRKAPRTQALAHILLLALSLVALPGLASGNWRATRADRPLPGILGLLALRIGIPYFVLASSTPLLQAWFCRSRAGGKPYRFYSLSNLGSLLAILAYPFLIEPALPLKSQSLCWIWCYAAFAALSLMSALGLLSAASKSSQTVPRRDVVSTLDTGASAPFEESTEGGLGESQPWSRRVLWLLLPACSSLMLLATTNQLCLDVAAVPLLWILPLGLYLLTMILAFHSPRWYSRLIFGVILAGASAWSCAVLFKGVFAGLRVQIASFSCTLFAVCMICHGELARLKPDTRSLTAYYGMIAAGGALGGLFVALLAPILFKGYWEYHLGVAATALLYMFVLLTDRTSPMYQGRLKVAWLLVIGAALALAIALGVHLELSAVGNTEMVRNFFGVMRVFEEDRTDPRLHRVILMHGRVQHGYQYRSNFRRDWPTSYYGPRSGAGLALRYHPGRRQSATGSHSLRIGVVGLGAGTLAAYAQPGDHIRFYEINPEVVRMAGEYFSYLKDCRGTVEVVVGDARISLERELGRGEPQNFDVLLVDAFCGDAVPIHLLTKECGEIYRSHLKQDGILALHVSSRYFDLVPVARGLTGVGYGQRREAVLVSSPADSSLGIEASDWVLLTVCRQFLDVPEVQRASHSWSEHDMPPISWTDDHSNIVPLLRRGQ